MTADYQRAERVPAHRAPDDSRPPGGGRVLLLFVDGVGLAPAGADNPLATVPMPRLQALLGGAPTVERVGRTPPGVTLAALDAGLGVDGLPQSATGQTALLTGENAPALLGHHVTAFPGPRLRDLLMRRSLLLRARAAGARATFANAFTARYFAAIAAGRLRHGAFTWATLAAGVPLRDRDALAAGRAVTWDVCGDLASERAGEELPRRTPQEAGRVLARLLADHQLVVYETFLPDLVGHRRLAVDAATVLARLDGLLGGLLDGLRDDRPGKGSADATVVLTSDHGNFEEPGHRRHTRNPVPLLAVGAGAERFAAARSLLDVAPGILALLGAEDV